MIALLFTVLVGAAIWWYRLKMVRDAGAEMADVFGKARGKMRRNKIRRQSEESPITAIDNPVIATASLLINLISSSPLPPKQEDIVRNELSSIANAELLDEALIYGRWVQTQPLDIRKSTVLLCEKLVDWLSINERRDVISMINSLENNPDISLHATIADLTVRKLSN